jgi:hypothetical protein
MAVVKFATLSNGNPRRDLTAGLPVVKTVPEIAMMVGVNKATISDAKTICASGTKEDITSVVNGSATITRVANMVRARRPEAPVTFDRPTAVPKGETISGLVRKGIKLQQLGEPALPLAKKLGLSWRAYRAARDIILLSENEYLSKKEMAVVTKALHDLDQTRMLAKAEQAVAPIAKRVWGHKGQRLKKSKPRVERHTKRFDGAITFLLHTCEIAVEMSIPQLDGAKVAEATRQLSAAETLLRKLAKRIREMQHD